jgi:hypothetical protein
MESNPQRMLKFVRVNITNEIVEVVAQSSTEVTLDYRGARVTLPRQDVILLTPEEEAAQASVRKSN